MERGRDYVGLQLYPGARHSGYQQMKAQDRLTMRVGIIVSGREAGLVETYADTGIQSGFGTIRFGSSG